MIYNGVHSITVTRLITAERSHDIKELVIVLLDIDLDRMI